jgi:RHS repeat-associated protein
MSLLKRLLGCAAVVCGMLSGGMVQAATTITYYHNDLLGSPVAATDASAHVIWRESYRPYGERLTNDPASTGNDVWYTSRRQDADTGLVYMGARYYDPVAGRFVSKDPVGFDEKNIQSFNRYAYANDNPYAYKDTDGRDPVRAVALAAYPLGVAADALSQYAAFGTVDFEMAATSNSAQVGAVITSLALGGALLEATVARTSAGGLTDSALVCRGGACTADRFAQGNGVTIDAAGNLDGVSVNSANGKALEELTTSIPNKQVGRTTVGEVRRAGGDVTPSPTAKNPDHCTMCGISAEKAEELFNPTVRNPNVQ